MGASRLWNARLHCEQRTNGVYDRMRERAKCHGCSIQNRNYRYACTRVRREYGGLRPNEPRLYCFAERASIEMGDNWHRSSGKRESARRRKLGYLLGYAKGWASYWYRAW